MREDIITSWASGQGLTITQTQLAQLSLFEDRLLTANTHMNLTAITHEADIAVKHFIDSLTLLPWLSPGSRVIDVGTGAGFPGLPLKIVRPDITVTLVDSLRKRVLFLQETVEALGLSGVSCVHARAEELSRKPPYRAGYEVCVARAVARLSLLAGYTLPFVRCGGLLLAMKGPEMTEEIAQAQKALRKQGGRLVSLQKIDIGAGITHTVLVIEKQCR